MSPGARQRSDCAGFTTVELVTVILLVALLAVVAAPSLRGLGDSTGNLAIRRLASAVRHAQAVAMATHRRTWVAFDTATDTVSVFVEDPGNPGRANRLAATDPLTQGAMSVALDADSFAGIALDTVDIGGTDEVEFDSMGRPYNENGVALAADGTATLSGGQSLAVTPNTGHVEAN